MSNTELGIYIMTTKVTKPFRWPSIQHDLALAREVASCRPQKTMDWEAIAHQLSSDFGTEDKPVELKARGCRERMDRLLLKYQQEDNQCLKRYIIYLPNMCVRNIQCLQKLLLKADFQIFSWEWEGVGGWWVQK